MIVNPVIKPKEIKLFIVEMVKIKKSSGSHDSREQQCPAGESQGLRHCQPHISMDQVITSEVMHEMNGIINSLADCDAAHQNRHRVQRQSQHSHHP